MDAQYIALVISGLALTISIITLWITHLTPFSLTTTHDTPTFSLYKIMPSLSGTKDGKAWWIPSFDLGFSFLNTGKRPGKILDLRIVANIDGPRSHHRYVFYPKWIVDYSRFNKSRTERFVWIDEALQRAWYPVPLSSQKDTHVHVILEGARWEERFEGKMRFALEIITSDSSTWSQLARYDLIITEDMFDNRCSYAPQDEAFEHIRKT